MGFLRFGVPDEGWGARKILREYVTGELLHCEPPLGFAPLPRGKAEAVPVISEEAQVSDQASTVAPVEAEAETAAGLAEPRASQAQASDSDFSDLDDFLNERCNDRNKTKRQVRQQNKRMQKGG